MLVPVTSQNFYLNEKNDAIMYFASQISVAKILPIFEVLWLKSNNSSIENSSLSATYTFSQLHYTDACTHTSHATIQRQSQNLSRWAEFSDFQSASLDSGRSCRIILYVLLGGFYGFY